MCTAIGAESSPVVVLGNERPKLFPAFTQGALLAEWNLFPYSAHSWALGRPTVSFAHAVWPQ